MATTATEAPQACAWPTSESIDEGLRAAQRAAATARHAAEDAIDGAALAVRRHPLESVGVAAAVGALAGAALAAGLTWALCTRRK